MYEEVLLLDTNPHYFFELVCEITCRITLCMLVHVCNYVVICSFIECLIFF